MPTRTPSVAETTDLPICEYGDSRLPQRFWEKVTCQPDGCWTWSASRDPRGYGYFGRGGKLHRAHRYMAEAVASEPLGEKHVLHRCDNPPCCNPQHLFLGDQYANMQDRAAKQRGPGQGTTHCKNGHEWTPENTSVGKPGQGRKCKRCNADRMRGLSRQTAACAPEQTEMAS